MKICYLADSNSEHTKKWCDFFKERHEITVISLNDSNINTNGVRTINLGLDVNNIKKYSSFNKLIYLSKIRNIRKAILSINPDILHAHYASSYALLGSIINYHPFIVSAWGSDIYDFPKRNIINKLVLKHNLKKADYIFSTSKCMANEMTKYTDKKIKITPFGVDTDFYQPNFNKNNKNIIVGINKSLEDIYGIEYLIKAIYILKNEFPSIKLKIAGGGSCEAKLKMLVDKLKLQENVEFLGRLNKFEIKNFFDEMDIAVYPSLKESFGVAALEAQACGIPVIISDEPGLLETTLPEESSFIVEKRQVKDIVDKLKILINNKELRNKMGSNGRKYVCEKFDLYNNFQKISELYDDILCKRE